MAPVWWKEAIVYQVWPASFKDGNGDGWGDIPGIVSKLDYLKSLGADTVWLSPVYASPQVDMGYDISDYEAIDPKFGTMDDMDQLLSGLHERGMRLLMDLVINHTSDQHPWFKESRLSRNNPKSDWFIWRDSKIVDGKKSPPNNWASFFGGSAWKYVAERDQWYLHLFTEEQPDLNWEIAETRRAIYDTAIKFWLDKGMDGFRVDTANLYSKDQSFKDLPLESPGDEFVVPVVATVNGPRMHEFWQEMHKEVFDKYKDVMLVGEMAETSKEEELRYVRGAKEFSMMFDFSLILTDRTLTDGYKPRAWTLPEFKDNLAETQGLLEETAGDAWVSIFLENHDNARSVSRFGRDNKEYHSKATKLLATLISTSSGTVFMYQGEEIGMTNIPKSWTIDDLEDVNSHNYLREIKRKFPGDKAKLDEAFAGVAFLGRDNARTPVQWDDSTNAGFSSGKPWMRVNDNYTSLNIASQEKKQSSPLHFWRKLNKMRKEHANVFVHGYFKLHDRGNLKTFTYSKVAPDGAKALVVLNMSDDTSAFHVDEYTKQGEKAHLIIHNGSSEGDLEPWDARVYLIKT